MLMFKTIPGSSISTANELQVLGNVSTMVGLEQRVMVERLPGVAFNNERDQKLCQTQGSERSNHDVNGDASKVWMLL